MSIRAGFKKLQCTMWQNTMLQEEKWKLHFMCQNLYFLQGARCRTCVVCSRMPFYKGGSKGGRKGVRCVLVIDIEVFWKVASEKGCQELERRDTSFCIIRMFGCILSIFFSCKKASLDKAVAGLALSRKGLHHVKKGKAIWHLSQATAAWQSHTMAHRYKSSIS